MPNGSYKTDITSIVLKPISRQTNIDTKRCDEPLKGAIVYSSDYQDVIGMSLRTDDKNR